MLILIIIYTFLVSQGLETDLVTSTMMLNTLKLRGSLFIFSLSVIQIRSTKMAKYESCDNVKYSANVFLPLILLFVETFSWSSFTGRKEVLGGRYLKLEVKKKKNSIRSLELIITYLSRKYESCEMITDKLSDFSYFKNDTVN